MTCGNFLRVYYGLWLIVFLNVIILCFSLDTDYIWLNTMLIASLVIEVLTAICIASYGIYKEYFI